MFKRIAGLMLVSVAMLTGCASSRVAGTWKMAPGQQAGKVTIARMTLAGDGTFLAEAEYGAQREVMDGHYRLADGALTIITADGERVYGCRVDGDRMVVTHDGESINLNRVAPYAAAKSRCCGLGCTAGESCRSDCEATCCVKACGSNCAKSCCASAGKCGANCAKPCCASKAKCGPHCNKPCCANKHTCPANCKKPCCAK